MSTLGEEIAETEAKLASLKRQAERLPKARQCAELGHVWRHIGGCNAGCSDDCACSVPVHECARCGDCDYGNNAEAEAERAECAYDRELFK